MNAYTLTLTALVRGESIQSSCTVEAKSLRAALHNVARDCDTSAHLVSCDAVKSGKVEHKLDYQF